MDAVGTTSTSPRHELGQKAEVGGNVFVYVYHTGTVTISQYYPAVWDVTNNYYIADSGAGLGDKVVAGLCATNISPGEYGWVCQGGIYLARVTGALSTVGANLQGAGTHLTHVTAAGELVCANLLLAMTAAGNAPVLMRLA
jgi:hypothetical protein